MPQRLLQHPSAAATRGRPALLAQLGVAAAILTACTTAPPATVEADPGPALRGQAVLWLDRVTWGANDTAARELATVGEERYLAGQLKPTGDALPAPVQATIAGFSVSKLSLE